MPTEADTTDLYLEDLYEGRVWKSPTRTITETDVVNFAGTTGDYFPLHTSDVFAQDSVFSERIAHGLLGLSYPHGLMWARTGVLNESIIAFLGLKEWKFQAPIYLGDTIHVEYRVNHNSRSRTQEDRGKVVFEVDVLNQHDSIVQAGKKEILIRARTE